MNIKDYFYLRNRFNLQNFNTKIDLNQIDQKRTVSLQFGLSKEEDAIYSYTSDIKNKEIYNKAKENFINLNNQLVDFKKIFIINSFLHYNEILNKENSMEDFFIDGIINEDELAILVFKEASNGFVSPGFFKWLSINVNNIDTYIVSGFSFDTDIYPFVIALKSFYKEWNKDCNIIIDLNSIANTTGLNKTSNPNFINSILFDSLIKEDIILTNNIIFPKKDNNNHDINDMVDKFKKI